MTGGWHPREGILAGQFGSLLVGVYEGGSLLFASKVGTGVTGQERARLGAVLAGLAIDEPPSIRRRREVSWTARWVRPVVVADVPFAEWTSSGTLRHPSHVATRGDKEPRDVVRESRRLGPSGR